MYGKLTLSLMGMSKSVGISGLPVYLMHWFSSKKRSNHHPQENNSPIVFDFDQSDAFSDTSAAAQETSMKKKSTEKGLQAINQLLLSVVGSPRSSLETKKTPITDDYSISQNVLGLGINGKVVEVKNKKEGSKYALKVSLLRYLNTFQYLAHVTYHNGYNLLLFHREIEIWVEFNELI